MKLSEYAKNKGISYKTAYRWFKEDKLPLNIRGEQTPSGTIILTEVKYKKGFKMIPDYNLNNIITDRIDDNVDLDYFNSFVELFKSIRDQSYRRNNKTFFKYLLSQKTYVSVYI